MKLLGFLNTILITIQPLVRIRGPNFFRVWARVTSLMNGRRCRLSGRGSHAIQPSHFRSSGALFPQIPREMLEEGLLLEIREHLLHDLPNVDEPKRIGWVVEWGASILPPLPPHSAPDPCHAILNLIC